MREWRRLSANMAEVERAKAEGKYTEKPMKLEDDEELIPWFPGATVLYDECSHPEERRDRFYINIGYAELGEDGSVTETPGGIVRSPRGQLEVCLDCLGLLACGELWLQPEQWLLKKEE